MAWMKLRLGAFIRQYRQAKGWNIAEFASRASCCVGYISRIETCKDVPAPFMVVRLAQILDAQPAQWLELAKQDKVKLRVSEVSRKYDDALALWREHQRENTK